MYRSMQDLLAFLRESGSSMAQYSVFMRLYKEGPCAISDLAETLGASRAAASQMVERLTQQGLVCRAEGATDRRFIRVELTPAGRELTQACIAARYRWLDDIPPLSAEQQAAIVTGLDTFYTVLSTAQGAPNEKPS